MTPLERIRALPRGPVERGYRQLVVWERAMELLLESHRLGRRLPAHEQYDLTRQLRRAASSVPANIVEGQGRYSPGEFLQQLSVANGSLQEVEQHLLEAVLHDYLEAREIESALELSAEVGRMLSALSRTVRRRRRAR